MSDLTSFAELLRDELETASAIDGTPAERLLRAADAYVRLALAEPARFHDLVQETPERANPAREVLRSRYGELAQGHGWELAAIEERFDWLWAAVHATASIHVEEALAGAQVAPVVVRRLLHRQLAALLSATEPRPAPELARPAPPAAVAPSPPAEQEPGDPSVYDYLHYRDYVRSWLTARAGRTSLRALARNTGISAPLLSAVLAGERDLNEFAAAALANVLGLDEKGRRYFADLVDYDQAGPVAKRTAALNRLTATRRFHVAPRLADLTWALFRAWYVSAILELVRCDGFREDPEWIARTLRPSITPAQAREALALLQEVGLLERDAAGRIQPAAPVLFTDHEVRRVHGLALRAWHLWHVERATHALGTLPPAERHFAGATFAASPELVADIKQRIERFMEEAVHQGAVHPEGRTRVFQVSVQLFPVTRDLRKDAPTGS